MNAGLIAGFGSLLLSSTLTGACLVTGSALNGQDAPSTIRTHSFLSFASWNFIHTGCMQASSIVPDPRTVPKWLSIKVATGGRTSIPDQWKNQYNVTFQPNFSNSRRSATVSFLLAGKVVKTMTFLQGPRDVCSSSHTLPASEMRNKEIPVPIVPSARETTEAVQYVWYTANQPACVERGRAGITRVPTPSPRVTWQAGPVSMTPVSGAYVQFMQTIFLGVPERADGSRFAVAGVAGNLSISTSLYTQRSPYALVSAGMNIADSGGEIDLGIRSQAGSEKQFSLSIGCSWVVWDGTVVSRVTTGSDGTPAPNGVLRLRVMPNPEDTRRCLLTTGGETFVVQQGNSFQ